MSAGAAIEAEGLVKSYGDVRALDGVDLAAPTGTVLGLLGPNGAGKTTAVRILTTLLPADGGSARVADGTTVLLTTQYLDEADRLADRISVIDHGKVIAEGTSDELKDQVGGEALEVTLEAAADAEAAIAALDGFCSAPPERDGVVLRVPVAERKGTIAAAVQRLNDAGVGIDDISMRRPTLDDVFLNLTGHAAEEAEEGEG